MTEEKGEWGGAREGAGRPEQEPLLKKHIVPIRLPQWMIEKIDQLDGKNRTEKIEKAIMQATGWRAPIVVKEEK